MLLAAATGFVGAMLVAANLRDATGPRDAFGTNTSQSFETLRAHATSGAPMVMVASVSAPASCAAGARAAKGLAASSLGTACTATDETRAGCTATKAELLPKHSAATAARYIVYESDQFVDLLDKDGSTLIEAKQLETMVLSPA